MEDKISGGSYIKSKIEPISVYKVTDINNGIIDATSKGGKRVILNLSEVELADDEDIFKYEENSIETES